MPRRISSPPPRKNHPIFDDPSLKGIVLNREMIDASGYPYHAPCLRKTGAGRRGNLRIAADSTIPMGVSAMCMTRRSMSCNRPRSLRYSTLVVIIPNLKITHASEVQRESRRGPFTHDQRSVRVYAPVSFYMTHFEPSSMWCRRSTPTQGTSDVASLTMRTR